MNPLLCVVVNQEGSGSRQTDTPEGRREVSWMVAIRVHEKEVNR